MNTARNRKSLVGLGMASFLMSVAVTSLSLPSTAMASSKTSVTVFAASSLQEQFTQAARRFERANPMVRIRFSFGSSTTLANQIATGAPADIFVAADQVSMRAATDISRYTSNYVTNQVVLAIPIHSTIASPSDLTGNVIWLQCAHSVPCGAAAERALAAEGVTTNSPVSLETSDSTTFAKLLAGAVDAAIVYKTDVIANPLKVRAVEFKDTSAASTIYRIGISQRGMTLTNPWVKKFFRYLKSSSVKISLKRAGFQVDSIR
ncbi:MAG: molybdate ABC transporter substrate-binding protein [Actinobacteria bacterium]|nr:molybdate ABC transporter substrate-binding protein [Actinomycetota bacterium]